MHALSLVCTLRGIVVQVVIAPHDALADADSEDDEKDDGAAALAAGAAGLKSAAK